VSDAPARVPVSRLVRVGRVVRRRILHQARSPLGTLRGRVATAAGAVLLALVALAFAKAGDVAQAQFLGLVRRLPWLPLVLTPALFALVAWVTVRFMPDARGSGIPQVIAASRTPAARSTVPLVSLRTGLAKLGLTVAMLLGGASVGREGPTVQVSASLMVAVHRWLRVPIGAGVLIAGGAAGVSAAFNTPLAGIAFAIEELAAQYEQRVAVMVMGAVMIAGLVSLGIAGDYVYFGRVATVIGLRDTFLLAPLAGIAGGLGGGLFTRLLLAHGRNARPWITAAKRRPVLLALAMGIVVAAMGLLSGGSTWGTGYLATETMLKGGHVAPSFVLTKFVASLATSISGTPGGIFAPSLAVGAGLGNLLAYIFSPADAGALVLLGMAGYFVGVVRAPITAVIIVSETTGNHGAILALFATALIADAVSALVSPTRLYHGLAETFMGPEMVRKG
jgi:H+/Cl- antiporter ClcA